MRPSATFNAIIDGATPMQPSREEVWELALA
jgi:hypothetical protein